MKCGFCGKTGYLKEKCYKIIGYPSDFKTLRDSYPPTDLKLKGKANVVETTTNDIGNIGSSV